MPPTDEKEEHELRLSELAVDDKEAKIKSVPKVTNIDELKNALRDALGKINK